MAALVADAERCRSRLRQFAKNVIERKNNVIERKRNATYYLYVMGYKSESYLNKTETLCNQASEFEQGRAIKRKKNSWAPAAII